MPYPVLPWVVPKPDHKPATFRIDDSEYSDLLGVLWSMGMGLCHSLILILLFCDCVFLLEWGMSFMPPKVVYHSL